MAKYTSEGPGERTRGPQGEARPRHRNAGRHEQQDDDFDIPIEGLREHVPEGWYEAKFTGWYTAIMFSGSAHKVFLRFQILDPGPNITLVRPYRARQVITRGERGKFTLDGGGDLYRMLVRVLDEKQRRDRITFLRLKQIPLRIKVRTVRTDRLRQPLAEGAWYSVVEEVDHG